MLGGAQSHPLTVRTRWSFRTPASAVWPLICNSRMDPSSSPLFELGVPRPIECRVPDGTGGVGSERECVSDQGVVHQRILEWTPEKHLSFRMERTDIGFRPLVDGLMDSFDFAPTKRGVTLTRTTRVWVRGRFPCAKEFLLFVGLKHVHRYVFRNWQRLAESASASAS
jgi:hypothetical protein